jgi:PAB1-binding protein PBP1
MGYLSGLKKAIEGEPSLEELQQREERKSLELSIQQKQTLIKELEARGRKWEQFSVNGKKSGINFEKIRAFLLGTKGAKK